jgi:hypothetical protein
MRTLTLIISSSTLLAASLLVPACGEEATIDAERADAGEEHADTGAAPIDGDAPRDDASRASAPDAGSGDADASVDASTCPPGAGTVDYALTASEDTAVTQAVAAFEAAHAGVSVTLGGATKAVTKIEGEIPVSLDPAVVDPCDRALAALTGFFTENAPWLRLPPGLAKKSCSYDSITDSEIVRLDKGTYYDGRPLVGGPTELLVHVRRDGHIKYWRSDYTAVLDRPGVTTCLDGAGAAAAAVGAVLDYARYEACAYEGPGSVTLSSSDSYVPLDTAVFVDASDRLHFVRLVDAFLAPSHVTQATGNSDLFCCTGISMKNCVGKTLAVDERTGEVLAQFVRCHTC